MSFAIQLADGRVIGPDVDVWTQEEAAWYLGELRRQADNDDAGDDLIDVFGFVVDDHSRVLSDAVVVPIPGSEAGAQVVE